MGKIIEVSLDKLIATFACAALANAAVLNDTIKEVSAMPGVAGARLHDRENERRLKVVFNRETRLDDICAIGLAVYKLPAIVEVDVVNEYDEICKKIVCGAFYTFPP